MIKKHRSVPGPEKSHELPCRKNTASGVQLPALPLSLRTGCLEPVSSFANDSKSGLLQHCGRQRWGTLETGAH